MVGIAQSHKEQVDAGIRESLRRAGLPANFIQRSLTSLTDGDRLVEFVKGALKPEGIARAGGFIRLSAPANGKGTGMDSLFLMARAFHLSGVGCRIVSSARLIREAESRDYEAFEEHRLTPMIVVPRFEDTSVRPFDEKVRWQIEDLLLGRMGDGKPVMVGSSGPFGGSADSWWSPGFYDKVSEVEEVVSVTQ